MATQILRTLDPRDEARVKSIQGMCHELHIMPPPVAYVGLEVYQCPKELLVAGRIPDGLKLDQIGVEPATVYNARSQSWVRNAYNIVMTQLCGIDSAYVASYGAGGTYNKNTAGTNTGSSEATFQIRFVTTSGWLGTLGTDSRGIVVGTGTGAEDFEDYALDAAVANGTGAGQLSYAAQETTIAAYTAGTKTWASTMVRYLNNNSGGAIVVGETGIYAYVYTGAAYDTMVCRDLQDPTVSVADTAQLKVTYTITSMAYPA